MDRIEFEVDDKQYIILKPTQQQIADADLVYKANYSEALRRGALTHAEAVRIIKDRNIWTSDDDVAAQKFLLTINELGLKLSATKDITEGLGLVNDIEQKRAELILLNNRRNAILDNTAESYADEKRLHFYITKCLKDTTGAPIYKDEIELIGDAESQLAIDATKNTIYLIANEGLDFRAEWPDYKWKQEHGILDKDLNPVEGALEKLADEALASVKAKQAEPQKRAPRRKKRVVKKTT